MVVASKPKIYWQWFKLAISCAYVSTLWFQLIQNAGREKLATTFESILNANVLLISIIIKCTLLNRRRHIVELANFLAQFERHQFLDDNKASDKYFKLDRVEKLVVQFFQISGISGAPYLAITNGLARWFNPCTSTTFGVNLLPECSNELAIIWKVSLSMRLVTLILVSAWLNLDLAATTIFHLFELAFLQGCCLKQYIKWLRKVLQAQAFDLRNVLVFKQIQILARIYNWIQQGKQIGLQMNVALVTFISSVFVVISEGSSISIPHLLYFSLTGMLSLQNIVITFGTFGAFYKHSVLLKDFMVKNLPLRIEISQRRLYSKYSRSFQTLKIRIGKDNFFETCTPMVLLNFAVTQIASLLLIR